MNACAKGGIQHKLAGKLILHVALSDLTELSDEKCNGLHKKKDYLI